MLGPLFWEQGRDIGDRPCSGQPTTAVIMTKKTRLMRRFGMTSVSWELNSAPRQGLENWRLWPSSEKLAREKSVHVGCQIWWLFSLILPTVLIWHCATCISLASWKMQSEDAVLQTMMSWNTVCVIAQMWSKEFYIIDIQRPGQR